MPEFVRSEGGAVRIRAHAGVHLRRLPNGTLITTPDGTSARVTAPYEVVRTALCPVCNGTGETLEPDLATSMCIPDARPAACRACRTPLS
ncbi:hypothetical protein [Sphingomonas profundi]|uniref:hypothetical protein n=1 Tax=Alterirhizorhabdus profundi TaxID=2681549 RepID=UPI0012E86EE1|nr:hypothetical protein [Sphingomonas profundi]